MRRAMGAAALLLACAGLTACGHSSSTPQTQPDKAGTSAATGTTDTAAEPGAAKPKWDCKEISIGTIDYFSGARGEPSREAALARYRKEGDSFLFSREGPTKNMWLVVDDQGYTRFAIDLLHTHRGWLVSTVEKCAT